jgi:DNA-binding CsgD family transcriptional regulator
MDEPTRALIDIVDADPLTPIQTGIVAPGGYGKTTILTQLDQIYRRAGVEVVHAWQAGATPPDLAELDAADGEVAVIVDDAHLLGDQQLRQLCQFVETQGARQPRLVVAYRPWPRSAALSELADLLARTGPPLMPTAFDREQIRTFLTALYGSAARATLVDFLHTQTGGVPGFVERVATALASTGAPQDTNLEIPQAAITQFRYDIDRVDEDVQRFLLAVEAGVGLHIDLLGALLHRDSDELGEIMEAARATGLLGRDGSLLPISRRVIKSVIPTERRISVRQRLAELQLERGASVLGLACSLLGTGVGGASVAAMFEAAAEEAVRERPGLAAELFAAAVSAGRPMTSVAAGWARAAALAGDLDSALRLADQVIATGDTEPTVDRAGGASVAASALAHRGQLGRSAELHRWAGAGSSLSFAAIGLVGTGDLASARRLLDNDSERPGTAGQGAAPPTLFAGAASLMAEGVLSSVTGSALDALSTLVRAAALLEPAGQQVLLPDSPSALGALVGLHCGELSIAESVLERAVTVHLGGSLLSARHRLLQAWISMARGRMTAATEYLAEATKTAKTMEPRDWLFAVALDVGLARRNNDLAVLRQAWGPACEAVMRHPVDLFTFLPLGEFAMAAARLRDQSRLAPHLLEARALVERLGNPPLWAAPLHWSLLHAALIAEQPDAANEHAAALTANAGHSRYCAALAGAAECWLDLMGGKIDSAKVEASARSLHGVGLSWDGARLAGQAAIRTSDRKAMVALLDCARVIQGKPAKSAPAAPITAQVTDTPQLSDREREVAALVVDGLTYKQVGDRLFISAKTVEHHMARMRQRLGVSNRSELLAQLRQILGQS